MSNDSSAPTGDIKPELLYEPFTGEVGFGRGSEEIPYAIKIEGNYDDIDAIDLEVGRYRSREEIIEQAEETGRYGDVLEEDGTMDSDLYATVRNEGGDFVAEYADGRTEDVEVLEEGDRTYLFGMEDVEVDRAGKYAVRMNVRQGDGRERSTGWNDVAKIEEVDFLDAVTTAKDAYDEGMEKPREADDHHYGFKEGFERAKQRRGPVDSTLDWATSYGAEVASHMIGQELHSRLKGFRSK